VRSNDTTTTEKGLNAPLRRKVLVAALNTTWPILALAATRSASQDAMTPNADDVQALRALNKRFIHNFVTNDVPSHSAILHPAFRSITSSGRHVDRASYLRNWATGFDPNRIIYWDMRDERITLLDGVALVTATNQHIVRRDGMETIGMTCYTDSYVRTNGNWLCALAQLTPVARENYPSDETIVVRYLNGNLQQ
jgi:hypothetical protein